jgi:DNA-binding CsgD family transcriptional regulator
MSPRHQNQRPPTPVSWRDTKNAQPYGLTLMHVALLRRVREGATLEEAATAIDTPLQTVRTSLRKLRAQFGVSTTKDLLSVPHVAAQLANGGPA